MQKLNYTYLYGRRLIFIIYFVHISAASVLVWVGAGVDGAGTGVSRGTIRPKAAKFIVNIDISGRVMKYRK